MIEELWPVKGMTLEKLQAQNYGRAWEYGAPRDGGARLHKGVDMYGTLGEPVYAMRPGFVTWVGPFYNGTYGIYVSVTGQDGVEDVYGELDPATLKVFVGDVVSRVTLLGGMGDTQVGMPPMLHLEHHEGGNKTSPMPLLERLKERT